MERENKGERDNKEERGRGTTRKRGERDDKEERKKGFFCFFIIKKERERMGGRIREG